MSYQAFLLRSFENTLAKRVLFTILSRHKIMIEFFQIPPLKRTPQMFWYSHIKRIAAIFLTK